MATHDQLGTPESPPPGRRWLSAAWELRFALLVVPIAFVPLVIMVGLGGMSPMDPEDWPSLLSTALTSLILLAVIQRLYVQRARAEAAHEALATLASTDPLTGLGNRRELWKGLERANKVGSPRSILIVFDLNDFKLINDSWGHAEGDRVLITFALALRSATRAGRDALFRTGGDEFVALLAEIEPYDSAAVVERVLECFRTELERRAPGLRCTAAAGMAPLVPGEPPDSWLHRADAAMYSAKACSASGASRSGRTPHPEM